MGLFAKKDWRDPYRRLSDRALLERIRQGDEQATEYLMETYTPLVLAYAKRALTSVAQALGDPGDFAHDAILLLWERARTEGADVLNYDGHQPLAGWLKRTVTYRLCNAGRKEQKHWRDNIQSNDDDEPSESVVAQIADPDAVKFACKPEKSVFDVVEEVLAVYPQKTAPLDTLVRKRLMESLSWKETAAVLGRLYPANDPAFDAIYVERSYWGRHHKIPFTTLLRKALIRYGYDS